ncbi:MAG: CvpA family protein [Anaerolineae bacterium]
MIQLSVVMWTFSLFFAFIGFQRGWNKEIIATSGIILALFALHQFDTFLRQILLGNMSGEQVFMVQTLFFAIVVYFAYQTRAIISGRGADGRDNLQEQVLGGIIGFVNGYLIWGSIWYFLDINGYPAGLNVVPPPTQETVQMLPLYLLAGGPTGPGDLLSLIVIILFLIVLIVI